MATKWYCWANGAGVGFTAVRAFIRIVPRCKVRVMFISSSAQSPRLLELTFSADTTTQFLQQVAQWPVQALAARPAAETGWWCPRKR
jgi:hypothetical protein